MKNYLLILFFLIPSSLFPQAPTINSFTPTAGNTGALITIRGSGFLSTTSVSIGGNPASSFIVDSATGITAIVGAVSAGAITITTPLGTASLNGFISPSIRSFLPTSGTVGTIVTIKGYNLSNTTAVSFGGVSATNFNIVSDTVITAKVGKASSGSISLVTSFGSDLKNGFTYTGPPTIASFSPTSGPVNSIITITGSGFDSSSLTSNTVFFGTVIGQIISVTPNTITAFVPPGTSFQRISITSNKLLAYSKNPFYTTFSDLGLGLTNSTFSKHPFPGSGSGRAAVADFNADGKPDVAFPSYSFEISHSKNISTGIIPSFEYHASTIPITWNPNGIATGNLDKDSLPDIVVSSSADKIYVFKNTSSPSNISFNTKAVYSFTSNSYPISPIIDDFNDDGMPDIAVANYSSNKISIFRNNCTTCAAPVFSNGLDLIANTNPTNILSKDMDGDNLTDIIVGYNASPILSFYRNISANGYFGFAPKYDFTVNSTSSNISSFTLEDMNNDNIPDLQVTSVSKILSLYKNISSIGSFTFSPKVDYNTGVTPRNSCAGDLNGDAKPEFILSKGNSDTINVFKNISSSINNLVSNKFDFNIPLISTDQSFLCDMNGDGKADLVTGYSIFRNKTGLVPFLTSFTPSILIPSDTLKIIGGNFYGVSSVTLNGFPASYFKVISDSVILVVASLGSTTNSQIVLTNDYGSANISGLTILVTPKITFFSPQFGPIGTTVQITGSGFSNLLNGNQVFFGVAKASITSYSDTIINVLVPLGANCDNISVVISSKKLSCFSLKPFNVTFPGAGASFTQSSFGNKIDFLCDTLTDRLLQGDFDSDGKPDLLISKSNNENIVYSIHKNLSLPNQISFTNKQDFDAFHFPLSYKVCDINADGKPDIVTANFTDVEIMSAYINVTLNNSISFSPPNEIIRTAINGEIIGTADLDQDGRTDLFERVSNTHYISIVRNVSNFQGINFGPLKTISENGTSSIVAGDLNGDSKPDLVSSQNLKVYKNTSVLGSVSFANASVAPSSTACENINLIDFDNDGKLDILFTRPISYSYYSIVRNTSINGGNFSFDPVVDSPFVVQGALSYGDLDGDGKIDIVIAKTNTDSIAVIKNLSTPGTIKFAKAVFYKVGGQPNSILISDIDLDGKLDIVTLNSKIGGWGTTKTYSILKNRVGDPQLISLCPNTNVIFGSNITGANYQWQIDTGSGFVNISDNSFYTGTSTETINIQNTPSSWAGYKYRCVVDNNYSYDFKLLFKNTWTGAVNNAWENPGNWSCGSVPNSFTDVVINSGVVVISSNIVIRSLSISLGVNLDVLNGSNLTILN